MMSDQPVLYLDHAATTPVDAAVVAAMLPYWQDHFGNPSSRYGLGNAATEALSRARSVVAGHLGCAPDEIVFTGSGTESANLAVLGAARANRERGNHVIVSAIEHEAVLKAAAQLAREGFEVTPLPVTPEGLVEADGLRAAVRPDTVLVSIMLANNEVGTIQPVAELVAAARAVNPTVLFHTDACQAAGYLPVAVTRLGVDMLTVNGSKLYGPKGVGALYLKQGARVQPLVFGGGQERGLRSGTESVPLIVGLAAAWDMSEAARATEVPRLTGLRDWFIAEMRDRVPDVMLNGHPTRRLPNNISLSLRGVEGDAVVHILDEEGIAIGTGSACTATSLAPSHVLMALGRSEDEAYGTIRLTMGRSTTADAMRRVADALVRVVPRLRALSPG